MSWRRRPASSPTKERETYAYYLRDLGYLVREAGEQTTGEVGAAKTLEDTTFEEGRRMAYIEVLSLMQQQADVFGIPVDELCLDGLDPEHDLLRNTPSQRVADEFEPPISWLAALNDLREVLAEIMVAVDRPERLTSEQLTAFCDELRDVAMRYGVFEPLA